MLLQLPRDPGLGAATRPCPRPTTGLLGLRRRPSRTPLPYLRGTKGPKKRGCHQMRSLTRKLRDFLRSSSLPRCVLETCQVPVLSALFPDTCVLKRYLPVLEAFTFPYSKSSLCWHSKRALRFTPEDKLLLVFLFSLSREAPVHTKLITLVFRTVTGWYPAYWIIK